jgi:small subunit ribosomal protein S6
MRRYELMVILDPDLEEKTVSPSLETYLKIIKDGGGKVK